jgi:hypothetical protein
MKKYLATTLLIISPLFCAETWDYLTNNLIQGSLLNTVITLNDGTVKRGEIVFVNSNNLQLKFATKTINIERTQIAQIIIEKESKALFGVGIGMILGGTMGLMQKDNVDNTFLKLMSGTVEYGTFFMLFGYYIGYLYGIDVIIIP